MSAAPRSGEFQTSDAAGWALLLLLALGLLAVQLTAPLTIDPASLIKLAVAGSTLVAAALFYRWRRPNPAFAAMCFGLTQVLLFSAMGALLSYALARNGGALWDESFARWDRALGFDWLGYVRWVDQSELIATTYRYAYASLVPQVVVLVIVLGFTLRLALLRAVLAAAMISGTSIVLLSALFPAESNFVALGLKAEDFTHVNPFAGFSHYPHLVALREGTEFVIRLPEMQGIITFPSYHAGLATVTLWGFVRSGIAPLQWLGGLTALLTILATPVDGGHYVVDVLAGIGIAAASILAARQAVRWSPALRPIRPSPFRRSRAASGQ